MFDPNPEFSFQEAPVSFNLDQIPLASKHIFNKAAVRAKKYLASAAEFLESVIELDQDRTYEKYGETYLTPFLVKYYFLSEDVAGMFVRVARKSQQVPEIKTAVDEGRLDLSKAKTIASVVTEENKEMWIKKAETLSKHQLEAEVAKASPSGRKPEKAKPTADGLRLDYEIPSQDIEQIQRVRDLVSRKLGKSANWAEVHVYLAEYFAKREDPLRKAERAKARKEKTQKDQSQKERAIKREGAVKDKPVKEIKDTEKCIQPDKSQDGYPPQRKKLKAELVHALNLRDQGRCRVRLPDGTECRGTRWVQFHHVIRISDGGADTLENLITVCSTHHRMWHEHSSSG